MNDDVCTCGHLHATTRGDCNGRLCDCQHYVPGADTPLMVLQRRRALLEATDVRLRATYGYKPRRKSA